MLDLPHHDGSSLHVSDLAPSLGDTVEVMVRVPHRYPVEAVHLRSMHDGEPRWARAEVAFQDKHDTWWQADLLVGVPVTAYRFLLDRGSDGYAWLTGTGVHDREVSDATDFRISTHPQAPDWVRDGAIYQVFPDRFARSGLVDEPLPAWAVPADWDDPVVERGPDTPHQIFGGDLIGVERHLDHLADLGVTVLYLTPFFPAASNHRYDAASFDEVDPLLGGDQALIDLVEAAHAKGLKVVGDLTTNHTGRTHGWFQTAQRDPAAPEAGFYLFTDHPDGYVSWLGEPSLPKLDLTSPELRRRLIEGPGSVVARYLRPPFNLDGWRIDVANMTGRNGATDVNAEVAATIRRTMAAVDDRYLLAEHFHDPSLDLRRDGWHGVMNYLGFLRPLWSWLGHEAHRFPFLGMPVGIANQGGEAIVATMREASAQIPWTALTGSTTLLGSHDTPRVRTIVGGRQRQLVAFAVLMTYPGIPMLFMGDEFGVQGIDGEDARIPMPWDRPDRIDERTWQTYRDLLALRIEHPALRHGGLRWAHTDTESIAYLRETSDERLLVIAVRDGRQRIAFPGTISEGTPRRLFGAGLLEHEGDDLVAHLDGPDVGIWVVS